MARGGFDWRRMSRWCGLGTLVMLVWLLAPVARCSWVAFRDTPLSEYDAGRVTLSETERARIKQDQSFFDSLAISVEYCYRRTPIMGQEPWKGSLLLAFAVAALAAGIVARITTRRDHRA